jgi:hypothetical protein
MQNYVALGGFFLGLLTSLLGALAWYGSAVRKRYAAERDFQHLKNNYAQLAANQGVLLQNLQDTNDALRDIHNAIADLEADVATLDVPRRGMRT